MDSPLTTISLDPPHAEQAEWLLVILHGWGSNAADVAGLAPYLQLPKLAVRCVEAPFPHPQALGGRMWYSFPFGYDFRSPPAFDHLEDLQISRRQLHQTLEALAAITEVPLARTILAGFSQGGAMTLDVGSRLPLAGQIVLSGYLHSPPTPPSAPRPVLMVHGHQDPVVPVVLARQCKHALKQVGLAPRYVELPIGHEISPEAIEVIVDFCDDLTSKPPIENTSH